MNGMVFNAAMPMAVALPPLTPFYIIADWVIVFTDSFRPSFRMSKAIAQKSPLGILGVTQNKAPLPARKLAVQPRRKSMGGRPYMKKSALKKLAAFAAAGVLAAGVLAGCAGSGSNSGSDDKTITVAASPTPHAEILTNAVADQLKEQGYTLEVKEFTDYIQPNTVTEEGEVDANYFQHQPYLDSFNEEKGTHLVSVEPIHFEPFGLYAGKTASLDALADGATVAVPNDTTNEARALLLLQQEGLIKLADGAGITATAKDIVENPKNLQIKELEAANIPNALKDVDIACINGNYAQAAGLSVEKDALAVEATDSLAAETYANVLVVKDGNQDSEKIQALAKALKSDAVRDFINKTYEGAVVPVF